MAKTAEIISAFSDEHVERLTGLTKRQLQYWDKTGFFKPQYAYENHHSPYSRIYSFRDVVGLRTLAILRLEYRVPLQHLRQVAEKLSHLKDDLWTKTTLYVLKKRVHFENPKTGKIENVVNGQYALLPLRSIFNDIREKAQELEKRKKTSIGQIERNRYVAHNAWVVADTRIPTKAIQRFKEAGYTIKQIMREYPSLTQEDIQAALDHEERLVKSA